MAKLSTAARKELPKKDFAIKGGHYPIEDKNHARNALARVSEFGSSKEKAEVRTKVHKKFPSIGDARKAALESKKDSKDTLKKVHSESSHCQDCGMKVSKMEHYASGHNHYDD